MKKSRYKAMADIEKWRETQITTMDEFESFISRAAVELAKKAQAVSEVTQKLKQVKQDTETASTELGKFLDKAENLAVDSPDEEPPMTEEQEQEMAKASLLEELGRMATEAINQKNIKLAYKIERTIDAILFEEK